MIIEVNELQEMLADVRECPRCRVGRAIVIEENAGPHSWDVVALHYPTCRGARVDGSRHLTAVNSTAGGDAA